MSDEKKEKKDNGGLEDVARKAIEIAKAVAAEVRKLKEQLVNEGVISNPAATMSGAEAYRMKGKSGHVKVTALVGVAMLFAVITGGLFAANELVWKVGDSAYVDMEGDATFNSVAATTFTGAINGTVGATTPAAGAFTTLVLSNATTVTGLSLDGTYTGNAIDFSGTTINPTGANGPCLIRAGTYATPIDYGVDSDQSGMIRVYSTSAGTSSYDRAIFAYTEVTSSKGGFPISGLAEANNTGTGPSKLQAGQFIAHLGAQSSGAHLTTAAGDGGTGGMFGLWAKVAASATATCDSDSIVAAIWADNAMSGTSSGTEYGIYATTTGNTPDGFIGFKTYTSGYSQLLYFEDSFSSNAGTCVETAALGAATNQDARIKVWYDGAQYYIPLYKD